MLLTEVGLDLPPSDEEEEPSPPFRPKYKLDNCPVNKMREKIEESLEETDKTELELLTEKLELLGNHTISRQLQLTVIQDVYEKLVKLIQRVLGNTFSITRQHLKHNTTPKVSFQEQVMEHKGIQRSLEIISKANKVLNSVRRQNTAQAIKHLVSMHKTLGTESSTVTTLKDLSTAALSTHVKDVIHR